MLFGGGSCHMETSRLVCVLNRLTGFCMAWVSTESFFQTDCLIVLISFTFLSLGLYDVFWIYLWITTLEKFIIFTIFIVIIIIGTIIIIIIIIIIIVIIIIIIVITVISSVRRVITNDQRLTEYSRLYISNTFLSILAVPNKAVF